MELSRNRKWNKYSDFIKSQRKREHYDLLSSTDYPILPGEGETDYPRSAPSDRFVNPALSSTGELRPGKYDLDSADSGVIPMEYYRMLIEFRKKLQKQFGDVIDRTGENPMTLSYAPLIKQAQTEITRGKTPMEKYEVAKKLILGTGIFIGADINKTFMFHETVVYGLNVLGSVYTILNRFKTFMVATDYKKIQTKIGEAIRGSNAASKNALSQFVTDSFTIADDPEQQRLVRYWVNAFIVDNTAGRTYYNGRGGLGLVGGRSYDGNLIYSLINRAGGNIDDNVKVGARFLVNAQDVMFIYLNSLFLISSNFQNLVDVKFYKSGSLKVHIDFSKLRDFIEKTIQNVKHYIDLFRPFIKADTLRKYEDKDVSGSLYWLEDKLMDKLIKGLPTTATESKDMVTLDKLTSIANDTFIELTKKTDVNGNTMTGGSTAAQFINPTGKIPEYFYETYGDLMAFMLYYESSSGSQFRAENKDLVGLGVIDTFNTLISIKRPSDDEAKVGIRGANAAAVQNWQPTATVGGATTYTGRIDIYDKDGFTENRGLMFMFNQVLAKYLKQFYDPSTAKIYQNLVNSFANGTFSSALTTNDNRWPDIIDENSKFRLIGSPTSKTVLLASLVMILRSTDSRY